MKGEIINSKSILNYEIDKINFYKKNNQEIGPIVTEEYCQYEEEKYGDDLCNIYRKISDIREGKKIVNNILIQLIICTFLYVGTLREDSALLTSILYCIYIIGIITKISNNSKAASYIGYLYEKAKYNLKNKEGK